MCFLALFGISRLFRGFFKALSRRFQVVSSGLKCAQVLALPLSNELLLAASPLKTMTMPGAQV